MNYLLQTAMILLCDYFLISLQIRHFYAKNSQPVCLLIIIYLAFHFITYLLIFIYLLSILSHIYYIYSYPVIHSLEWALKIYALSHIISLKFSTFDIYDAH